MVTANPNPPTLASDRPGRQRVLLVVTLALFVPSIYLFWRHFQAPSVKVETVPNAPLLKHEGAFRDDEVGLRFTPPPQWANQLRTTQAPGLHPADRILVKYKRVLPNQAAAWFRVHVVDLPPDEPITDVVLNRNPGHDWTSKGAVRSTTVAGLPAAEIRYGGTHNEIPSVRDILGVRRGGQVFFFVSTYPVGDRAAEEQTREAIKTVLFGAP